MMKFRINISGKMIHGPECGEGCNLDDADEVRTVGFREATRYLTESDFDVCERLEPKDA